jgi:hypothetical protein
LPQSITLQIVEGEKTNTLIFHRDRTTRRERYVLPLKSSNASGFSRFPDEKEISAFVLCRRFWSRTTTWWVSESA